MRVVEVVVCRGDQAKNTTDIQRHGDVGVCQDIQGIPRLRSRMAGPCDASKNAQDQDDEGDDQCAHGARFVTW